GFGRGAFPRRCRYPARCSSTGARWLTCSARTPPMPEPIHTIDPNGIYFLDQAQSILRLRKSTIRREHREGRLRIARRAGRIIILGAWLIEWIKGGEVKAKESQLVSNGKH